MKINFGWKSKMDGLKLLIADDDRDDYDLLVSVFREQGYLHDFVNVKNGAELLDYLTQRANCAPALPDLVLLDINMPVMDGMQALEIMKVNPVLALVPVIIYSTSACREQMQKCYLLGANGFITKECSMKNIVTQVNEISNFLTRLYRPGFAKEKFSVKSL